MPENSHCRILWKQRFQLRKRGLGHGGQGLELSQQILFALGADTGDAVQFRVLQALAAELSVIGDGEAVGLLLNVPDQREDGLVSVNAYFLALRGHQCPGAVPVVLYHTEHRESKAELFQGSDRHGSVLNAAVDQQ